MRFSKLATLTEQETICKINVTDKQNPACIVVDGKTYITPTVECDDYTHVINTIKRHLVLKFKENKTFLGNFDENFILDIQISVNCVRYNKPSSMTWQLVVKQKNNTIKQYDELKPVAIKMTSEFCQEIKQSFTKADFKVHSQKKL